MTTNSIVYEKEFFHFDPEKIVGNDGKRKVINARSTTNLFITMFEDKKGVNRLLTSSYDLEIYPMADNSDVFCNIKTKMTWSYDIENEQELRTEAFAESLLHHIINQGHFATSLLRQNFPLDSATRAGLLQKTNPKKIFETLKNQVNFLADLNLTDDCPFLFSYWY